MIVLGVILLVTSFILAIPVLYEGQGGHGCSRAGIRGRVRYHTNRPQRRDREGKTHDQQIDVETDRVKPSSGGSMGAELSDSGADLTSRWIVQRSPCPWVTRSRPRLQRTICGRVWLSSVWKIRSGVTGP